MSLGNGRNGFIASASRLGRARTAFKMGLFDGTELERPVLCDRCEQDVKTCSCEPILEESCEPDVPPEKQSVKIRVDKRKRGKMVTVVSGVRGPVPQLQRLLTELKNHCGAGGTVSDSDVEIQGDHVARIRAYLIGQGYRVR